MISCNFLVNDLRLPMCRIELFAVIALPFLGYFLFFRIVIYPAVSYIFCFCLCEADYIKVSCCMQDFEDRKFDKATFTQSSLIKGGAKK